MAARITPYIDYITAGINPETRRPLREDPTSLWKERETASLRAKDQQQFANRFTWINLPDGLTQDLIEKVLYYRGQGALFFNKTTDTFYFLPYTLATKDRIGIDMYGRYTQVTPVTLGSNFIEDDKHPPKAFIRGLILNAVYEPITPMEWEASLTETVAIPLFDYSRQISQTIIPRAQLQEPIINQMIDTKSYMNTALINGCGVDGMLVNSASEQHNAMVASETVRQAALIGQKWVPIIGSPNITNLTNSAIISPEEYMKIYASLDNLRLENLGIPNGGPFEKNAHMLQTEQNMSRGNTSLVLQDGLYNRQLFCRILNSYFPGLMCWCKISETISGIDKNLDGEISDEQDNQLPLDTTMGGNNNE